jgi:hypothetical protein
MLHKCFEPDNGWFGGNWPFVGDTPFEEELPFVPFVVTPFPFVPFDEFRKPEPREKDDCGKLSSEEAYLGEVGPAPVGLNAPEEESKLFVSGFISRGLCGPIEDIGKFVSSDKRVMLPLGLQ